MRLNVTTGTFKRATKEFDKIEDARGKLYYNALRLINAGLVLDAHILILATWNTAAFRYALRKFNLEAYQQTVHSISSDLTPLRASDLIHTDLAPHRPLILKSFTALKNIRGVGVTGASKVLHLINTGLFLPWDNYIRGQKMRKDFKNLTVVRRGFWPSGKFEGNGRGYYKFLLMCQQKFRHLVFHDSQKTYAKQIDEFNFVNITVPLQKIQGKREKARKQRLKRPRVSRDK